MQGRLQPRTMQLAIKPALSLLTDRSYSEDYLACQMFLTPALQPGISAELVFRRRAYPNFNFGLLEAWQLKG
jgi:hypothetical protein